jgi:hypothetical protein
LVQELAFNFVGGGKAEWVGVEQSRLEGVVGAVWVMREGGFLGRLVVIRIWVVGAPPVGTVGL